MTHRQIPDPGPDDNGGGGCGPELMALAFILAFVLTLLLAGCGPRCPDGYARQTPGSDVCTPYEGGELNGADG